MLHKFPKKFILQKIMEVMEIVEDLKMILKDLEISKIMEYHQNFQKK